MPHRYVYDMSVLINPFNGKIFPSIPILNLLNYMIDKMTISPDRVYIRSEFCKNNSKPCFFKVTVNKDTKGQASSIEFKMKAGHKQIITVVAKKNNHDRWFVSKIVFCPSAILFGHNGRMILTDKERCLAFGVLRMMLSRIVEEESVMRVIPGTEAGSTSYIHNVEFMAQFVDPAHRFLKATHLAARQRQSIQSIVQYGSYTKIPGNETELRAYNKRQQWKNATTDRPNSEMTRAEFVVKKKECLAKLLQGDISSGKSKDQVVKTFAFLDSYNVLRRAYSSLTGFSDESMHSSAGPLSSNKAANLIIIGLGANKLVPNQVSRALDEYKTMMKPCDRTYREIKNALRRYLVQLQRPSLMRALPLDFSDFEPVNVILEQVEREYESVLKQFKYSIDDCSDILDAWSETSFLNVADINQQKLQQHGPGFTPSFGSSL